MAGNIIATAQSPDPEEVIREVYEVLAGMRNVDTANIPGRLEHGAWEALSYIEEADTLLVESLNEAVPDYYRFREGVVILKLINPENYNEYGMEATLKYRLHNETVIQLLDGKSGMVKEEWEIIYLDKNYLALDMGDLRVFFTHTPVQE